MPRGTGRAAAVPTRHLITKEGCGAAGGATRSATVITSRSRRFSCKGGPLDGGARAVPGNGTQGGTVVEDHVYRTGEDAPSALTGLITWISVTLNAGAAARPVTVFCASLGPAKDVAVTTTVTRVRCVTPPTRRKRVCSVFVVQSGKLL